MLKSFVCLCFDLYSELEEEHINNEVDWGQLMMTEVGWQKQGWWLALGNTLYSNAALVRQVVVEEERFAFAVNF